MILIISHLLDIPKFNGTNEKKLIEIASFLYPLLGQHPKPQAARESQR